jgi:hypothetical protein
MRLLIVILLFSFSTSAQIVRCNPFYKSNSTNLFLDLYPSATIALSLRKLKTSYNGNCIRVRRSNDNAEQDIAFNNNYLDTATMKTFVGANNGFVVTWYDQSGNGSNVTQATAASQPRIINAGVIDKMSNKPSIYFNGTSNRLQTATITNSTYPLTDGNFAAFGVGGVAILTGTKNLASSDVGSGTRLPQFIRINAAAPEVISFNGATPSTDANSNISANTMYLFSSFKYTGKTEIYTNNTTNGSTNSNAQNIPTTYAIAIGTQVSGAQYYNGNICEFIEYPTDKINDRTNINTAINSYYSLY